MSLPSEQLDARTEPLTVGDQVVGARDEPETNAWSRYEAVSASLALALAWPGLLCPVRTWTRVAVGCGPGWDGSRNMENGQ